MILKNVNLKKEANIYLDGKISSRTVILQDGTELTLGIMMPGEFELESKVNEVKEIISGEFEMLIEGEHEWKRYSTGMTLRVPANKMVKWRIFKPTDYCFTVE
jgi:purine/pyrimidine-nucleoside phosphorylase